MKRLLFLLIIFSSLVAMQQDVNKTELNVYVSIENKTNIKLDSINVGETKKIDAGSIKNFKEAVKQRSLKLKPFKLPQNLSLGMTIQYRPRANSYLFSANIDDDKTEITLHASQLTDVKTVNFLIKVTFTGQSGYLWSDIKPYIEFEISRLTTKAPIKMPVEVENRIYAFLNVSPNASAHEILGLDIEASQKDIRKAYKKLAFYWHPDRAISRGISEADANEVFKLINIAYRELTKEK